MSKYVSIIIILCSAMVMAQDDTTSHDERMYQLLTQYRVNECEDFIVNAEVLIPDYYYRNQIDSINMIINYVEKRCPDDVYRDLKLLLKIESDDFPEDWCGVEVINDMLYFPENELFYIVSKSGISFISRSNNENSIYLEFIRSFAWELALQTDSTSIEHLLCRYYSGDVKYPIMRLHNRDFDGYCIQEKFDERINEIKRKLRSSRGHWEFHTGVLFPQGNSKLLGEKLEIGGSLGFRADSWGMDISGAIRALKSKNDYFVEVFDTLAETDHFLGGMLGLDITREVFHTDRFEFEGVAGIAYDGFTALTTDDVDKGKSLNSFNFNFGINSRLFYNKTRDKYLGLKFRYNIVNYKNEGGTDLSGNSIAICLTYGFLGNKPVIYKANRLMIYD